MSELRISMLGGTGVGKTSLLTALYDQFDANIGSTDLQLTPDEESNLQLAKSKKLLENLVHQFETSEPTITGTATKREFVFGLGKKARHPSLRLRFVDYPGKYITSQNANERQIVNELLKSSAAIVVAIDTPAMLEQRGKWNLFVNLPDEVLGIFKQTYQELSDPRLVILVPMKCEKYIKEHREYEVLDAVKKSHKRLLELFQSEPLRDKVAVVITPVQTVGGVFFSHIKEINSEPEFFYRPIGMQATYAPKDSEQPLRYLLRFLVKMHHKERSQSWGWFSFVRRMFNLDTHLLTAATKFSDGCKTSNGFEVVQGKDLL